ncbi:MAG: CPBP family intramembrane metalloprotease, partial [Clostridia bacterium]|nr:CPBP family intramembrane metalloprotease [Clostridia bacterium]
MKKQSIFIIISVTVLSVVMNIVDLFIKPQYFVKSIIKIMLFLVVPIIYFLINRQDLPRFKRLFKPNKKSVLQSLILGLICYGGIVDGYLLLKDFIDFSNITKSLTADIGVNSGNFVFVALYISFVNSFLE